MKKLLPLPSLLVVLFLFGCGAPESTSKLSAEESYMNSYDCRKAAEKSYENALDNCGSRLSPSYEECADQAEREWAQARYRCY